MKNGWRKLKQRGKMKERWGEWKGGVRAGTKLEEKKFRLKLGVSGEHKRLWEM